MNKKRTNQTEVFAKVMLDLKNILEKKPPLAKMREEVRLMGFFIRPVEGDAQIIEKIDDRQFIEALWTIGKIDLLLEKNFHRLTEAQKQIVLDTLNEIQEKLIMKARIKPELMEQLNQEAPPQLMLEIFRRQMIKRNIN